MRAGDRIKIKYQGAETYYGIIVCKSNDILTAGEWIIDFINPRAFRATRDPNYVFRVDRIEELLYF